MIVSPSGDGALVESERSSHPRDRPSPPDMKSPSRLSPSDVKAYLDRDWALVREMKERYWAEKKRSLTPTEALTIAGRLRQQAAAIRPDWPDDRQREADLSTHRRVSECLRRVAAPTRALGSR